MITRWSESAYEDLIRLHGFLNPVNPRAADAAVKALVSAARSLPEFPYRGERLENYPGRDVRRLIVLRYELRYEVIGEDIVVVRVFHGKEDR